VRFWLGIHDAHWLAEAGVPTFVSHRRLARRRRLPRAITPWALDSGGFTELRLHGGYVEPAHAYAKAVERYADEIGQLAWAAPQDWMCEPFMVERTGLSVRAHQARTLENYLLLRTATPLVIPVLQGWEPSDYERHVEDYARAGVDLTAAPLVGVGSICRRQDMAIGERIVRRLAALGLRLHGFGVKLTGLGRFADALTSADSMAWSYRARRGQVRLAGCTHRHCANCLRFALQWREDALCRNLWMTA
jgi:hypothetical protein